jgi:glycosyltransferase involved in cell wall biosynthesis
VNITYVADIRFPLERANGIQTMETCHALVTRGHRVHLIVRPDTHTPARDPYVYYGLPRVPGLDIEPAPVLGPSAARRLAFLAFAAGRTLRTGRGQLVMTRDLGVASTLLHLPRALRPPLVYESHGYAPEVAEAMPDLLATADKPSASKLRRLTRREARVWRDADGYVTITRGLRDALIEFFGERPRTAVIPDGVAVSADASRNPRANEDAEQRPSETTGPADPRPLAAYAGHLYPWKGADVLIEALARVPEVDGLIVGGHPQEPDLERLRTLAQRLGLEQRITFAGMVAPSAVAALLKRATMLALPNPASAIATRFTSPLKLFEYMAAGRPIVASNLPAIREVLTDNVDALLVPPGDAGALADAIRRLARDPALGERLSRAALDLVPQYTWTRRAERLESLFDEVVGSR